MSLQHVQTTRVPEASIVFKRMMEMDEFERLEYLTEVLVSIPSVNGTSGEADIAEYLIDLLRQASYFQQNPEYLWSVPLKDDHLGRKNIFAFLKKENAEKTIIFHSHMDTVGVEDFADLQKFAFSPRDLQEHFKQQTQFPELKECAESGEWMFGRGATDMKSGAAVHISNLLYFMEHPEELEGNLLLMLNPVEENEHTGVIESVAELQSLREKHNITYKAAINNDFVTDLYEGDSSINIYTGAVGKLLPCFSIYGREAHVGETLHGVDPSLVSAEINRRINNNMDLAEKMEGEHMLPPTCLQQRDSKDFYNVQTALKSRLYFNLFIYERSPKDVMDQLKEQAAEACREVEQYMKKQYEAFMQRGGYPRGETPDWNVDVFTFDEYKEYLQNIGVQANQIINDMTADYKGEEKREVAFAIVEALQQADPNRKPKVVIFFAPPYCPHNYLREEVEEEERLLHILKDIAETYEGALKKQLNKEFQVKKFFPFLSDSSYLSLHDTEEEIDSLVENFPGYETIYPVPVKKIREANIPAINLGVYGKDAHQRTERLYKPYSFGLLPELTREAAKLMLK
ncbi:M20/M25/M40 family metallo-hydrolase [Alteribacillus iranensis]|uniref:Arginine utilization protein RocB n=1 Tax=Alteribacillus iranensis TaxID=930128 RepID=A0A1I2B332_9BACI|nr:M20/M25/M40 family metallo-hydrolase [Alteribacillus iranensis]SFE50496.1 Arginine utilization protein RocB [Alteribacillus iranensis]